MWYKNKPSSAEKQFMKDVADLASDIGLSFLYGDEWDNRYNFQIHHVVGRSYKQNKVAIGHWFILPVPTQLHDPNSNNRLSVTRYKNAFTEQFGSQKSLYSALLIEMKERGYILPPLNVINAIQSTRA